MASQRGIGFEASAKNRTSVPDGTGLCRAVQTSETTRVDW